MALTEKGKKLKAKFRSQYGKKKGDSVFYAMENSGKLKKVIKAKGGQDMGAGSSGMGSGKSGSTGDDNREQYGAKGQYSGGPKGNVGGNGNKVTVKKGPVQVPSPFDYTLSGYAFNKFSKSLYDAKNLKEQRDIDVLGGEMLTTGPTGPKGPKDQDGQGPRRVQPIQPIAATKPIDKSLISPKDNFFNFVAYKVGGLSGGVSYGPPPKKGPNSRVPPVKMKRGGYKK